MSSVVLSGDTSGTVTVTVPAIAGSNTVTIPAGTGTVAVQGVSTNIVSGTAVASTSGTSIDFTSIPSWVKRITVMFNGVSTNGTSNFLIQLGTSSGIETSGYVGTIQGGTSTSFSAAFIVQTNIASSDVVQGSCVISNLSANTWTQTGLFSNAGGGLRYMAGSKTLSTTLDRIRITTANGTDTFDAGSINILYE